MVTVLLGALCAALPGEALAELSERLAAIAGWQYDSNVYDLQSGFPVPGTSDLRRSDRYYSYGGQLDLGETYSLQNWFATAAITRYAYDHFTQLSHNEYRLAGGWNWKLTDIWDGRLEVLRTRQMVAFTEIAQTELAVVTEQRETALVGVQIMPEWRVEASGFTHTIDQPLIEEPNLRLTESSGTLATKYGGTSALNTGLSATYTHGSYSDATVLVFTRPAYNQEAVALTATYQPSAPSAKSAQGGPSTFDGAIGWSRRTSGTDFNTASGLIGHLDYKNQLTAKTSVQLDVSRAIVSFPTNGASELDTSAGISGSWRVTPRITVTPAYTWLHRTLPHQDFVTGTDRNDHLQFASLTIDYDPRAWIAIKPYARLRTRRSNLYGANFNAAVYGVTLTLALQHPNPGF